MLFSRVLWQCWGFFSFNKEWIKDIKLYSGTALSVSGWFMGVEPQFALSASCRTAQAGIKQLFILAIQKNQWQGEVRHQRASDPVYGRAGDSSQ